MNSAEMDVEGRRLSDEDRDRCKSRFERGAYYYSFEGTGVEAIDLILGAVSAAGKAYHHTESWTDKADGSGGIFDSSPFDAGSCVDLIDAAASEAAVLFRQQAETIERLGHAIFQGETDEDCDPAVEALRMERDTLARQLQAAVEESGKQQDALDLMRDEFIRIKAITSNGEIEGICDRAMGSIERAVPLVLHVEQARRQLRDTEFLYHAYFVLCKEAGVCPGSRELMEAADRFSAALSPDRAESTEGQR